MLARWGRGEGGKGGGGGEAYGVVFGKALEGVPVGGGGEGGKG